MFTQLIVYTLTFTRNTVQYSLRVDCCNICIQKSDLKQRTHDRVKVLTTPPPSFIQGTDGYIKCLLYHNVYTPWRQCKIISIFVSL